MTKMDCVMKKKASLLWIPKMSLLVAVCFAAITASFFTACGSMQKKYCGQWNEKEDNEISIDITGDEKNGFFISVTAAKDEETIYLWEMEGQKENSEIHYENAKKSIVTYDTYGNAMEEELYTDGTGRFYLSGNTLYWEDETENFAHDAAFFR